MTRAADWTKRVAAWRASGLGAAEFCAGQGYSAKSLWHWSSKFGRTSAGEAVEPSGKKPGVQLARVTRSTLPTAMSEPASIVVEVDGARLTVRGRIDADAVRALVAGLRDAGRGTAR